MANEKQIEALKRARAKRLENLAAKKAAPPVRAELPEFAGITNEDCPIDCTLERCVISGRPICAHPRKCGLQSVDKADPVKMERYNRAKKHLLHEELDRRP